MSWNSFLLLTDENNPDTLYRLRTEWCNEDCSVTILTENGVYRGQITEEEMKIQSELLGMPSDNYIEECKKSLHSDLNVDQYSYHIENDTFNIKKILSTKSKKRMKVKFASIKLKQTDFQNTVFEMFDKATKQIKDLIIEIDDLRKDNEAIHKSYESTLHRLDEMVQTKNHCEKVLYAKFLSILNSKKEMIAKLQGESPSKSINKNEESKSGKECEASSDDSAYNIDTDVDDEEETKDESSPETQLSERKSHEKQLEVEPGPSGNQDEPEMKYSRIENIMNTMNFLDPTVPFKKT